jgi:hypothetical protein
VIPGAAGSWILGSADAGSDRTDAAGGGRGRDQPDADRRGGADARHATRAGQRACVPGRLALASIGVAAPVVLYLGLGERGDRLLGELKDWLARNNTAIMAVLCLIVGVKLIGDGISFLAEAAMSPGRDDARTRVPGEDGAMAKNTRTKQLRELPVNAYAAVLLLRRLTPHLVMAQLEDLAIGDRLRTRRAKIGVTAGGVVTAGALATGLAVRHRRVGRGGAEAEPV